MDSLYTETNKKLHEIQNYLSLYERSPDDEIDSMFVSISQTIEEVFDNCDRLSIYVNKEVPQQRASSKLKVDQLKYDCRHLQAGLRNIQHKKQQKIAEEQQREMLLNTHFEANDTSINMDSSLELNQRTRSATSHLDELIHTGSHILDNVHTQGGSLKSIHKKFLDVANVLGLSNTVLRFIERRSSQDSVILFGGMIVTSIVMLLVYIYFV